MELVATKVFYSIMASIAAMFWSCWGECLVPTDPAARLTFAVNGMVEYPALGGSELYLGYDMGRGFGPFQPALGLAIGDDGSSWAGAGLKFTHDWNRVFLEASFMMGYFDRGNGPDLGGHFQAREAVGLGYRLSNDSTVTLTVDHRSNANTAQPNPGRESIGLRWAMPLGR